MIAISLESLSHGPAASAASSLTRMTRMKFEYSPIKTGPLKEHRKRIRVMRVTNRWCQLSGVRAS
jgi:hypothetical protein